MQPSKIDYLIHTAQTYFPASLESAKNLSFTRYAHLPHQQENNTKSQTPNRKQIQRDKGEYQKAVAHTTVCRLVSCRL
jgi:hypothetical protein